MAKVTKDDLARLTTLDDATRADLAARFDEIAELGNQIANLRKEKGDADVIVSRAKEIEAASQKKDSRILELEGLLAKHTGKPVESGSYGLFSGFFQEGFF